MYSLATIIKINEEAYPKLVRGIRERSDKTIIDDLNSEFEGENGLNLEEMLNIANVIKRWNNILMSVPSYNVYGFREYRNEFGYEGSSLKTGVRIEVSRNSQEVDAVGHSKKAGSATVDGFCIRAFKEGLKIGDNYIWNPNLYNHERLFSFYKIYDELEKKRLVQEKRKRIGEEEIKSKEENIKRESIESAKEFIEDLRRGK